MGPRTRPSRHQHLAALVALVALMMGLLPVGVATAETGARGTDHVCAPPFASSFDDIVGSVHADNILCMADLGLTEGIGDGTSYGPRLAVTRAQMASFIARLIEHYLGEELPVGDERFDDVPAGLVHADNIHKLLEAGITRGTSDGGGTSFAPQLPVTRGQMASFISRALTFIATGAASPEVQPLRSDQDRFPDDDGSVHEANINALASVGVVEGFADGTYRPGDPVLRGQMASFIMRSYDWAVVVGLGDFEVGAISGIVSDAYSNHPIVGAALTVAGTAHVATSQADGRYEIANVIPGSYSVTATADGYTTVTKDGVVVEVDETVIVDFGLVPTALTPPPPPPPPPPPSAAAREGKPGPPDPPSPTGCPRSGGGGRGRAGCGSPCPEPRPGPSGPWHPPDGFPPGSARPAGSCQRCGGR